MNKPCRGLLLIIVNDFFNHPMTVCVEVLHNVTTRQQQQQQQPLEAGRQIIFQKGVAWTNEPARARERQREREREHTTVCT